MLNQMQTIKVSEIYLNTWEIDHVDDNKQQLGKKTKKRKACERRKVFHFALGKNYKKKSFFLFSSEGIKSPKKSD